MHQCIRSTSIEMPHPPNMDRVQGEKQGLPRPCKLSVRQDLMDLGRVGSMDVTLKQRDQWPREKQQTCTSFRAICHALKSIPSRRSAVQPPGQRVVGKESQHPVQSIPFVLPPLIPIEGMQVTGDFCDGPGSSLRQPPPLIPIPQLKSDDTPSPPQVSPERSYPSRISSPQTPPLDLTQNSSDSRLQSKEEGRRGSSYAASDTAPKSDTDASGNTLDSDGGSATESRTRCPLCTQNFASLRVHLGSFTIHVLPHCARPYVLTLSTLAESYHKIDPALHHLLEKPPCSIEKTEFGTQTTLTGWPLLFWDRHFSFCEPRKN